MQFYSEFIRTVFQALDDEGRLANRIVAFTAATPGAGVSYVVNTLAKEIATLTQRRVLALDAQGLQNIRAADPLLIGRQCSETQIDNLLTLPAGSGFSDYRGPSPSKIWHTDPEHRLACSRRLTAPSVEQCNSIGCARLSTHPRDSDFASSCCQI